MDLVRLSNLNNILPCRTSLSGLVLQFTSFLNTSHQSINSFISLQLILNPNWPHTERLPLLKENTSLLVPTLTPVHCHTKQTARFSL